MILHQRPIREWIAAPDESIVSALCQQPMPFQFYVYVRHNRPYAWEVFTFLRRHEEALQEEKRMTSLMMEIQANRRIDAANKKREAELEKLARWDAFGDQGSMRSRRPTARRGKIDLLAFAILAAVLAIVGYGVHLQGWGYFLKLGGAIW